MSSFAAVIAAKALAMLDTGKADAALVLVEKALAGDPECSFSHLVHGAILQRLERFEEALAAYDRAKLVDMATWHYQRATCLSRLGRHKEALAAADEGIRVDPVDPIAWYRSGAALLRYARKNPYSPDRKLLQRGEAAMLRAIELDPGCYVARFDLAEHYFIAGKKKAAETMVREGLALKFGDPRIHRIAAYVALRAGRLEEAASHADMFVSACPDSPEAVSLMLRIRRMIASPAHRLLQRIYWTGPRGWMAVPLGVLLFALFVYFDVTRAQAYLIGVAVLLLVAGLVSLSQARSRQATKRPRLSPEF